MVFVKLSLAGRKKKNMSCPSREEIEGIVRDLMRAPTNHLSYEQCYRKIYQYSARTGRTGMTCLLHEVVPAVFTKIFLQRDHYLEYHNALTVLYSVLLYPTRVLNMTFEQFRDVIRARLISVARIPAISAFGRKPFGRRWPMNIE